MKPMLADDWNPEKVKYPVMAQPKIDGVRGLTINGGMTGRSLKPHANLYTTKLFSDKLVAGFDGELAAGPPNSPSLCRDTTSALNTITGEPYVVWWIFDCLWEAAKGLPYAQRYNTAKDFLPAARLTHPMWRHRLELVPSIMCHSREQLEAIVAQYESEGYEGTIIRDPNGLYKEGRSTVREGGLLRIKAFVEEEFLITGISEGQMNMNEATINALGHTERSTHQANMVPNGMVGTIHGKHLVSGQDIDVAPGKMTHEERRLYFTNPELIIGKIGKFKTFKHGVKDKPRFPTFQCLRAESDMG